MDWLRKGPLYSSYQPVNDDDDETQGEHELNESGAHQHTRYNKPKDESQARRVRRVRWIIGIVPILIILIIVLGALIHDKIYQNSTNTTTSSLDDSDTTNKSFNSCPKRREWRTLSNADKETYITAARCLLTQPSTLHPRTQSTSAYSDFPYIHAHVGYRTHHASPFLPWHRYFLHVYETTLRQQCNYTGGLVYWDWTLDYKDLTHSPVFDPLTGFGGDGDPNGPITVGRHGRCLVDGPFVDVQVLWYDVEYRPHCLSRGFRSDIGTGKMDGSDITPESIDKILTSTGDSYEDFVNEMEVKIHDTIPFGVGGDFETFTAPFDPLFYLHHVQLDRIWWLWQQRSQSESQSQSQYSSASKNDENNGNRVWSYGGHNGRHSIESARLSDEIGMGDLAAPVAVRRVMDTSGGQSNVLCYSY